MMMMMIIKWQTGIPYQDEAQGLEDEWSSRFGPIILYISLSKSYIVRSGIEIIFCISSWWMGTVV